MESMQTKIFDNSRILSTFVDILKALSPKEKDVIERRI